MHLMKTGTGKYVVNICVCHTHRYHAGHVGEVIIDLSLKSGAKVTATDINASRLDQLRDQWHGVAMQTEGKSKRADARTLGGHTRGAARRGGEGEPHSSGAHSQC